MIDFSALFSVYHLELAASGLLVGMCVGLTGVGAGSLMAPLLILFFKIDPLVAIGSDLLYSAPTKIVGALVHARQQTVDFTVTKFLSIGGLIGLAIGFAVLTYVKAHQDPIATAALVRRLVGVAVIVSALLTIASTWIYRRELDAPIRHASRVALVVLGLIVGIVVMMTSVGAGAITMPFLCLLLHSHKTQLLIGSDLAFSAVIATVAAVLQYQMHNINFGLSFAMLIGSIPGVIIGSRFSVRVPEVVLKPGVGVCLALIGLRML